MTACVLCGRPSPLLVARPRCTCGGLPAVPHLEPFDPRSNPERRLVGAGRFRAALGLPPPAHPPVTLGEAGARLEPLTVDGAPGACLLYRADLEPSGSAAATGAALLADALSGAGERTLHVDDAFDHAFALARYADGGRLRVTASFAPGGASVGHRVLLERLGVRIVDRPPAGDRWIDAHPARQPLAGLGGAVHAFRIVECLERIPADVAVPASHGTLLAGLSTGFTAMARAGVGPMPRLHAVQPASRAPLSEAFARGDGFAALDTAPPSAAGLTRGRGCAAPERDVEALDAALGSGGTIGAVDDAALERAVRLLWREGIKVEPWAALPVAWAIAPDRAMRPDRAGPLVLVASAHGVRDGTPLFDLFP